MSVNLPAIKASIFEIEAHRNRALHLYEVAYDAMESARSAQLLAAVGNSPAVSFGNYSQAIQFAGDDGRKKFLDRTRQEVDRGIWSHLMSTTKLESLMDRKAREEFRQQLLDDPPPATPDWVEATLKGFVEDAGTIFKRGVAVAFSGLDRRFRSHDGFKIGSRIVLTYAFAQYGSMSTRVEETIRDVERAFYVLDGKGEAPEWMDGICAKARAQTGGLDRKAFVVEDDYFTFKAFKNGNAHLWFKRDDLLERVNLLLAEYYGAALGEGTDVADQHAGVKSTAVAKNMGFFETPKEVVSRVYDEAGIPNKGIPLKILEPSAGTGSLARPAASAGHRVTCFEMHPGRAAELKSSGYFAGVTQCDFLDAIPFPHFDRVIMNPPFDRGLDMDHVRHAFKFLKPGGILCAVMSAATEFREDNRSVSFRAWAERFRRNDWGSLFQDLPMGSFKESGTMVNTCILTLRAPSIGNDHV